MQKREERDAQSLKFVYLTPRLATPLTSSTEGPRISNGYSLSEKLSLIRPKRTMILHRK